MFGYSDDSVEKDKDAINPEDIERALLNMPTLKSLMEGIVCICVFQFLKFQLNFSLVNIIFFDLFNSGV